MRNGLEARARCIVPLQLLIGSRQILLDHFADMIGDGGCGGETGGLHADEVDGLRDVGVAGDD